MLPGKMEALLCGLGTLDEIVKSGKTSGSCADNWILVSPE